MKCTLLYRYYFASKRYLQKEITCDNYTKNITKKSLDKEKEISEMGMEISVANRTCFIFPIVTEATYYLLLC